MDKSTTLKCGSFTQNFYFCALKDNRYPFHFILFPSLTFTIICVIWVVPSAKISQSHTVRNSVNEVGILFRLEKKVEWN